MGSDLDDASTVRTVGALVGRAGARQGAGVGPSSQRQEKLVPDSDEMKGRIKEAAGDLTDDKDLQREGKVDQASGKVKDTIDEASDKVNDALDRDD